jgi:hypothetical protein
MKYWTCACGQKHAIIQGQAIRCSGPGHMVYLSPAYFDTPGETKSKSQNQIGLFK